MESRVPAKYILNIRQRHLVAKNVSLAYWNAKLTGFKGDRLQQANDIALDGLCYAAYKFREELGNKFTTFATFVIRRMLTRLRRKNKYTAKISLDTDLWGKPGKYDRSDSGLLAIHSRECRPDETAETNDLTNMVNRQLSLLTDREREIMTVCGGKSFGDKIAKEKFGMTKQGAKYNYQKVVAKLRESRELAACV